MNAPFLRPPVGLSVPPGAAQSGRARARPAAAGGASLPALAATAHVLTPAGLRPAGTLRRGDLLCTADGAMVALGGTTRHGMAPQRLDRHADLAPVRIRRGALGEGRPWQDLTLGPHQLLRLDGPALEAFCGIDTILVAAACLVDGLAVTRLTTPARYVRLALDGPACLLAEGVALAPAAGPATGPDAGTPAADRQPPGLDAAQLRALMTYFARHA
jgi:hypothetical protein